MIDGRSRAHARRIHNGCPSHPDYRGKGTPPDCHLCQHMHAGWTELVNDMNSLLTEALQMEPRT